MIATPPQPAPRAMEEMMTFRTIAEIDKDINANRPAVLAAEGITIRQSHRMSASEWQDLRDRNPQFDRRDHALFRERGIAQLIRDAKTIKDKRWRTRYQKEIAATYAIPLAELA